MKTKTSLFTENIAESACSCLIMMVQGNMLLLTLGHWLIAMETGIFAGTIATALILKGRVTRPWVISVILGIVTAVIDFLVHPGRYVSILLEAALTGLGAAILSLLAAKIVGYINHRRESTYTCIVTRK